VGALEGKFWRVLCEALDRPDLIAGQLSTGHAGALVRQQLAAVFAQQTQAQWIERLADIECCVSPVLSLDESLADAQVRARDMIVSGADGIRQYAPPFRLSGHAFAITRSAPAQGQHSVEILREAGFSAEEIGLLADRGTISEPRSAR
jgi:crotonobetainyl-CoA:carnitine CoA-transferase CaiB-like acyl-CoA transferase